MSKRVATGQPGIDVGHGDVLISAITSCTNTSNPGVLLAAGLLAKKAVEKGLKPHPRVKTSLGPGSLAVTDYLQERRPADRTWSSSATTSPATAARRASATPARSTRTSTRPSSRTTSSPRAVLSGNRNFEARIHQNIKANFLMSPPLVVAFGLAGTVNIDMTKDPIGHGQGRQAGVPARTSGPRTQEVASVIEVRDRSRDVQESVLGVQGRQPDVGRDSVRRRRDLSVGRAVDLRPPPAVLRRLRHAAGQGHRRQRRARAGHLRRLDHDGPHQPGGRHPAHLAGGQVSAGARRGDRGLQHLRRAPRQSRSHDARHVRKRAHQEPAWCPAPKAASRCISRRASRRRIYEAAMRYKQEGVPLGGLRRRRIRPGLLARLGGERPAAPRRARP